MTKTITLNCNTLIVANYENERLIGFSLPVGNREYPANYNLNNFGGEIPCKDIKMRVSQAKKLGFEGFIVK
jgi:hypothetical protein